MRNEAFVCESCRCEVSAHPDGSARNHCPKCLASKHVDGDVPGDRASNCHGTMLPVGFENRRNKGLVVVHECEKCRKRIVNKLAPDDEYLPIMRKFATKMANDILE